MSENMTAEDYRKQALEKARPHLETLFFDWLESRQQEQAAEETAVGAESGPGRDGRHRLR